MASEITILDAQLLFFPQDCSSSVVEKYINLIFEWGRLALRTPPDCVVSEVIVDALAAIGAFPTADKMTALFRRHSADLASFDYRDTMRMLRALLQDRPYLEGRMGIRDAAIEENCNVEPAEVLSRLIPELQSPQRTMLIRAALGMKQPNEIDDLYFASDGLPLAENELEGVRVRATITLIELADGTLDARHQVIDQIIRVVRAPSDIRGDVNIEWTDVYNRPSEAIKIASEALNKKPEELCDVTYGTHFVTSIENLGLHKQAGKLKRIFWVAALAACGEIKDVPGIDLHPVRENDSADAAQFTREDSAKLWRCKVSQKGAGYRLHYWSLRGGGIELSEVMVESKVTFK